MNRRGFIRALGGITVVALVAPAELLAVQPSPVNCPEIYAEFDYAAIARELKAAYPPEAFDDLWVTDSPFRAPLPDRGLHTEPHYGGKRGRRRNWAT